MLATKDIKPNEHTLPTTFKDLCILLLQGVFAFGFQHFLCQALKYEKRASLVSILLNSQVLFVFVLDVLILGNSPSATNIIGALIICGAAISITLRNESAAEVKQIMPTTVSVEK